MTVYVGNYRVPARIGRTSGVWSHLTADTAEELHQFRRMSDAEIADARKAVTA